MDKCTLYGNVACGHVDCLVVVIGSVGFMAIGALENFTIVAGLGSVGQSVVDIPRFVSCPLLLSAQSTIIRYLMTKRQFCVKRESTF